VSRRDRQRSRPEEPHRTHREEAKIPGLGKSILDQLARDFGLKVPELPGPAPGPGLRRQPVTVPEKFRIPVTRDTAVARPESPRRGIVGSEAARSRTAPGATPLRVDLQSAKKLREAFVLKEILDVPVSKRPGLRARQ
jgi:hypothetical protein